jgi:1-aminocyclopropane-1-carboxylate deaminase/D-cysteine desulfhydrase-like pyridoxal-dependent ACC family enzyme
MPVRVCQVRKLEFLMAEAIERGHDSVITIGGIQSNHCRATAVAARYLGLEVRHTPALVLQERNRSTRCP